MLEARDDGGDGLTRRAAAALEILARHPGGAAAIGAVLLAVLAPPLVTYELAWEISSALGYVAVAAAVLCVLVRPAPGMPQRAYRFALHRAAGDALVLLALLHVAVMVAADPFMLDYLGWMMPLPVMLGVVATVLLALVAAGREPVFGRRPSWLAGARLPRLGRHRGWVAGGGARPVVLDPADGRLARAGHRRRPDPAAARRRGPAPPGSRRPAAAERGLDRRGSARRARLWLCSRVCW